jgi:hypothetical protein
MLSKKNKNKTKLRLSPKKIAFASLILHGAVSQAGNKVPALAHWQLKKWSLGDPLMYKLAACTA